MNSDWHEKLDEALKVKRIPKLSVKLTDENVHMWKDALSTFAKSYEQSFLPEERQRFALLHTKLSSHYHYDKDSNIISVWIGHLFQSIQDEVLPPFFSMGEVMNDFENAKWPDKIRIKNPATKQIADFFLASIGREVIEYEARVDTAEHERLIITLHIYKNQYYTSDLSDRITKAVGVPRKYMYGPSPITKHI